MSSSTAYWAFRAGATAARALPERCVLPLASVAGRLATTRFASRRLIAERNLARATASDLTAAARRDGVRAMFESYARYWIESFRLPGTPASVLDDRMATVGMEHIDTALDAGRGAVLALPHLGGWEWAAFWLTEVCGLPVTAVVEQIEPPELAEWFGDLRRQFGMEVVPFGPDAASACLRALKANHVLALLCDRDLTGTGVAVDFFGERTTIPSGPATLALRTGAALIPAAVYFDVDGRHLGFVLPALDTERRGRLREDVERVTRDVAGALETLIRRAPHQWHLLQPNWPSDHEALAAARSDPPAEAPSGSETG